MNLSFKIATAAIVFNSLIAAAFAPAMFVAVVIIVMLGSVIALRTLDGQLPPAINVGEVVPPVEEPVEQTAATADKPKKPRKRNYNRKPKTWSTEKQ